MRARIEAAIPAPRILVVRDAGADSNRPDLDVTIIDVPASLGGVDRAAASEGMQPIEARFEASAIVLSASNGDQVSRVTALALKRGKSVDFTGYWQRHIAD